MLFHKPNVDGGVFVVVSLYFVEGLVNFIDLGEEHS